MAKVAIKNVNITSFGGIYHIMDVFSKLGFKKLTESVLGKRGSSGKAFCYGSIFCGYHTSPLVWVGDFMLRKEPRNTEAPHINIQSPKKTSQHIKFSHKKKYCGIKDIRVLSYSSIFQMIIVFPFIDLKYFSFCCHSSHSILFWNPLVYSCFILIVKSDSILILNSSIQLSILFNFCLLSVSVYILFSFLFFVFICSVSLVILSLCYSVSFIIFSLYILSFLLFCLYVILSLSFLSFFFLPLCHSVFSLSFCLFFMFLSHFLSPFFPFILASFLPFHLFIF